MIVRISTEGQYELPDGSADELNEIDNRIVAAVEADDEASFRHAYDELLDAVRSQGTMLGPDELRESALIIPPPDLSLEEARHDFSEDGLLPD